MTQGQIRVPTDSTGKRVNTRERTIGGNTYQDQIVLPLSSDRVAEGRYVFDPGVLVVQASAHGAAVGFCYLWLPATANRDVAVRRIVVETQHGSVLATPTSPRLALKRLTAASGTTLSSSPITPEPLDTADATSLLVGSLASTGLTTPAEDTQVLFVCMPTVALTAVGAATPSIRIYDPPADMPIIIHVNSGLIFKQLDAGTASDTRRIILQIWLEQFLEPADVV